MGDVKWPGTYTRGTKTKFDGLGKKIPRLREKRNKLLANMDDDRVAKRIDGISTEIENLAEIEEVHWSQRSRINWLGAGDRNTKFFHAAASQRKKTNFIKGLVNTEGTWMEEEEKMARIISDYFSEIFSSTNPTENDLREILSWDIPQLPEEDIRLLGEPYSREEVNLALFAINPNKAPGLDGFPASFFHRFWPAMEDSIVEAVLKILNNEARITEWNKTLIVLIPKVKNSKEVKEYRSISLCNTIYKIVSKVLVGRIRRVIHTWLTTHKVLLYRDGPFQITL